MQILHCHSPGGCSPAATPSRYSRAIALLGVQFMYECVMGLRKHEGQGCILADEMSVTILCYAMLQKLTQFKGYGQDATGEPVAILDDV